MCKIYGYIRISTARQSIERQRRNIREKYPDAIMIEEVFTGTKIDRPKWAQLYRNVKTGDTIVFDEVSRMARNAEEGFSVYQNLYKRGVELVFLKEPHINTEVYKAAADGSVPMTGTIADPVLQGVNEMLFRLAEQQIRIAFEQAQAEVEHLHQRTKEGIETARLAGKQIGAVKGRKLTTKKSIAAKEQIRQHSKDFGGSLNDIDCMKLTGLARNTFYKYKREMKEQLSEQNTHF